MVCIAPAISKGRMRVNKFEWSPGDLILVSRKVDMTAAEALMRAVVTLKVIERTTKLHQNDAIELLNAIATLQGIVDQRGCEHFDPAVRDGKLTTLIDVIMVG